MLILINNHRARKLTVKRITHHSRQGVNVQAFIRRIGK